MTRKNRLFAVLLSLAISPLSGCAVMHSGSVQHKVTVSQHNFLQVVSAFQDAEINEYNKGFVPRDVHLKIQTIIEKVGLGGKDLDNALIANADAATLNAKITAIYNLLDQISTDGLTGIKNPDTKSILDIALNSIKGLLDVALTQVATTGTTTIERWGM
jgi:hypothetical protein